VGANTMQRVVQVPSALIMALNGLVVVFVVSSELWRKKRQRKRLTVDEAGDTDHLQETETQEANHLKKSIKETQ
jgi:ABC-type uncharacterized transport system permease subunit